MTSRTGIAWAPVLPTHWGYGTLRWLATIYAGGTPNRENPEYWLDGSIPWLNSGSVNDWSITEPSELISEAGYAGSSARWVPAKSVVIGLAGQGRTKGTSARLEIEATTNQSMAAIVPGPRLDYRFLHYWLVSNYASIRNLAGGDKRDGLNLQHIAGIECPLPPLDEQRAIADYLDRETAQIDTLIATQQRLIERLYERRIAEIADVVVHGLDTEAEQKLATADWLDTIPATWEEKRLKWSVESVQVGAWGEDPHGDGTDVICVRVADFDRPRLTVGTAETRRWLRPSDLEPRLLSEGDLLLEKSGGTPANPVGFVAYVDRITEPTVCSNFIARLRLVGGQESRYWLYTHAASHATRLTGRSYKQTTGIQNLDQQSYFDELFPFPPLRDQRAIAAHLDRRTAEIDELIGKTQRLVDLARERRAALITAAVTGQLDIRAAA